MAKRNNYVVLIIGLLTLWSSNAAQDCSWDKDAEFPDNPPLLIDSSFELVLPVLEGDLRIVRVASGSDLTIACPGETIADLGVEAVTGTCSSGNLINIDGDDKPLSELGCTDKVSETISRNLGSCGDGGMGVFHAVGFEIATTGKFYEVVRVCFDPVAQTTLFSQHVVHGANIEAKDIDSSRPSFKTSSGFFTVSMSTVYAQKSQLELMEILLGDAGLASEIIDPSAQLYFAKGHMSPDADFVTEAEQDATYYYINALPQWQAFNNGNWKYLEFATRDLASGHGTDLTVYSGGWGILELDDINGNPVEIFLGLYQDEAVVPAPALTWKVVHEESTNQAAAIVGINNPHITTPPEPLCQDICSSLSWIDFDLGDLGHGYTYCCTVADLRAAIPHVPDLGDVDLLEN